MKKLLLTSLLIILVSTVFSQVQTTFVLVRHSEKADDGTKNPPLNEQGKERSQNLADLLNNQEITALYSTPFKRTQETLQPIAELKNVEVQSYDPFAKASWLSSLISKHEGGTVVISGHSNTIPNLANALLGKETFSQFDESDYSNLIMITTEKVGSGTLIWLKF